MTAGCGDNADRPDESDPLAARVEAALRRMADRRAVRAEFQRRRR